MLKPCIIPSMQSPRYMQMQQVRLHAPPCHSPFKGVGGHRCHAGAACAACTALAADPGGAQHAWPAHCMSAAIFACSCDSVTKLTGVAQHNIDCFDLLGALEWCS